MTTSFLCDQALRRVTISATWTTLRRLVERRQMTCLDHRCMR
jgi:hypothetical protein